MKVVLLGGNGYIGRGLCAEWSKTHPTMEIYVVSRTKQGLYKSAQVKHIEADVKEIEKISEQLPESIDYIVNLIGKQNNNPIKMELEHRQAATTMLALAEAKKAKAMGLLGTNMGPDAFQQVKRDMRDFLKKSIIPLAYMEVSVVRGGLGRKDKAGKMIWFFEIISLFNREKRPLNMPVFAARFWNLLVGASK